VARADLGRESLLRLDRAIRDSIEYAHAHRAEALSTMRAYAQELSDDVLWKHVDLYVNAWTRDLGPEGERALAELARRAETCGWPRGARRPLSVLAARPS
jgi:1,4-dihydroxy-6-naphthoate synthase